MPLTLAYRDPPRARGHWTRALAFATAGLALMATPLEAQTWTATEYANESLLFGGAYPPQPSLGFGCTAPAPENRPLFETGSHESHRTDPFEVVVEFFDPLFEWTAPYEIQGIVITVDATSYLMPPLELNELQGSAIYLPMTDPFILSLFEAQSLVFDTGQGTAYSYPVDGLGDALRGGLGYCAARWVALGHAMPESLAAVGLLAAAGPPPDAVGALPRTVILEPNTSVAGAVTPGPSAAGQVPPSVQDAARQGCPNETVTVTRDQLQIADLDGDGAEDFLLHHGAVQCANALNMFCGAANCSIDAFLSTQDYRQYPAFLGMGAEFVPLASGRTGVQIAGTFSLCGETGLCPGPLVWTGASFELEAPAQAPAPKE